MTDHDFLPGSSWVISTHEQLKGNLQLLEPKKLDEVVPQLKEWREHAHKLLREASTAVEGMARLTEERDQWKATAERLRIIGKDMAIAVARDMASVVKGEPGESLQGVLGSWNQALTGAPWETEVFHLYRNAEVIYCARSLDHCWELFTQDMDLEREHEEEFDPFEQIPDDEVIETASEDPSGSPDEELRPVNNKDGKEIGAFWFEKKTAGEWATISRAGHFSGGDY